MANITTIFLNYLNPRKIYLWSFLLIVLLVIAGYYVYKKNYSKVMNQKGTGNIPNANTGSQVQILLFTVDWCPHCKKARTPWEDFKTGYHNKRIGDYTVTCVEYNVTEGNANYDNAKAMQDKYEVDSYPTVKMLKGGQVIDFDAKITTYSLEKFVENML
jgi:glutaredoxin